jgi:hypothetical protein
MYIPVKVFKNGKTCTSTLYSKLKNGMVDIVTPPRRDSMTQKDKMLKPSAYFLLLG